MNTTVPGAFFRFFLRFSVLSLPGLQLSDEQALSVLEIPHLGASCEWDASHHVPTWHLVHNLQL